MKRTMSQGSHNTTIPMNHKANAGGKMRSKQPKPNRTARRQFRWVYEAVEE